MVPNKTRAGRYGQAGRVMNRRQFAAQMATAGLLMTGPLRGMAQARQTRGVEGVAREWSPMDFGAVGDGTTKETAAIQAAIDRCAAEGGGRVVLVAGKSFLSGSVTLRSHVELHLEGGSRLLASTDRSDYHATGALLFAKDAEDLHVSGTGVIDGQFAAFFAPKGPQGYAVPRPFLGPYDPLYPASNRNPPDGRPRMILLVGCKQVLLEGFTIRDAPTWTIHPIGCDGLHIVGITIQNDLDVPNCDGIDIDHCRQVRVEGCNIVAGDDCLVLKASRNFGQYGPCEGVVITNCTLESSSAGIKVETEGAFPLRSVAATNCSIVRSNRGISFLNRDGATVEDMLFSGMTIEAKMRSMMWWGSGEPVALSSVPRVAGGPPGLVRDVTFADLLCRGESGIYLRGLKGTPVEDVTLRGIELAIAKTTAIEGGFYDMRPGDSFGASGLDRRPTAGVFATEVRGLALDGVGVRWTGATPSYYGAALELHECTEVSLRGVTGRAAHEGQPAAVLDSVQYAAEIAGKPV